MIEAKLGRSIKRTDCGISLSANLFLLSEASGEMEGAVFLTAPCRFSAAQGGKQLLHVIRHVGFELHHLAGAGVFEGQKIGMQRLSREAVDGASGRFFKQVRLVRKAAPYSGSPISGWPIWAICTRIWCVRPVSSRHSTKEARQEASDRS